MTGGANTLAVGNNTTTMGDRASAFGNLASADGQQSTAAGYAATADGPFSVAVGTSSTASAYASTALGQGAIASGAGSVALGTGAQATQRGSVALGGASATLRGAAAGYSAFGLAPSQDSVGEIAIAQSLPFTDPVTGLPAVLGNRQITGVAAGSADTDAVNVSQLRGVSNSLGSVFATSLGGGAFYNPANGALTGPAYVINGASYTSVGDALAAVSGANAATANAAVLYDTAAKDVVTLGGAAGTTVRNVAPATLAATSTDAVNGSQLFATNQQVGANTAAITTLSNNIAGSTISPVQYSNAATPTVSNGGVVTNDVTLVGSNAALPVAVHNVAAGTLAAGSTDAANGAQLYSTNAHVAGDTAALGGGAAFNPATGTYTAPTYTVQGAAVNTVGGAVAALDSAVSRALVVTANTVGYDDASHASLTLNSGGAATTIHNVAAGVASGDAVNVGQLQAASNATLASAEGYTDLKIAGLNYDLRRRMDATGAKSAALAGVPQSINPGSGFIGASIGGQGSEVAFAMGVSKVFDGAHLPVVKAAISVDARGYSPSYNVGAGIHF
ncbi:hypothetical protein KZX46_08525 [Polymorphobacter sp. PAMC 29334]|uniref:hypothetical protein n=1 Tax=Polymorphobacter sp. PAMC 29334 TaxID=2862331 RepID=UPI001C77B209|nr:hypothetical protein [Polymorphobacter sp. PAMC 29334]QYE35968.1 hypothetical protein KZX46_08525 [Polymorphobacter sp. PAMC 29334]